MGAWFVPVEPVGQGDVELKRIKCPRGGSGPQPLRMGYALCSPEQLGQFPFSQGLTREFSDRPSAGQGFFERHLPLFLRRRQSQDTCRTGFCLDHSGTHG